MAIVQEAFWIPDDITTGLATGTYRRMGGVVRYATGANKGQIVKHLQPIDLKSAEQTMKLEPKALQLFRQNKKTIGIVTICMAAAGLCAWAYTSLKNSEPKVQAEYRAALKTYIIAVQEGNLDIDEINNLMNKLEAMKKNKDYRKISIQLSAEELEVIVNRIYEYTVKLAKDNSVELNDEEMHHSNEAIVNLYSYLEIQKRIFETAV